MFCTVHRSKGLEAKVVYILRPDLMPHPKGNAQEERNLKYVAITRAKERLIWVNGK
jgi:superfamily I DNA/RNA helicase